MKAVKPTQTIPTDSLIDIRWLANQLVEDKLIDYQDGNQVATTPRTQEQINWHPLEVMAHYRLQSPKSKQELTIERLTKWLSLKADLPLFHIDPLKIDVAAVTNIMSYAFAERHHILAVQVNGDEIVLATSQPFYSEWEQGLSQVLRDKTFKCVLANPADIHRFRIEFYNLAQSVDKATQAGEGQQGFNHVANFEQLLEIKSLKNVEASDQHVVNIVDWLLQYAFDQRASDIHLEMRRESSQVRFRIDGLLHEIYEMPTIVMSAVISRLKILGRMNVAEKRKPQDGRLKTKTPANNEVELRLSTLPTAFGEKLVMRIFDPDIVVKSFVDLGFSQQEQDLWLEMVAEKHGIILVTGPTGSGKTTTLYSTLKQLATPEVNVCTLEDPIEMVESRFNQVQIQAHIDFDFSDGIRALLRQDPDIIMVGEIRDLETAEMAIQAALTGHLVISTLHTNDVPSAVVRLLDLGVPSYLISATIIGIMAQRLIRTLCPKCKKPATLEDRTWQLLTAPWKGKKPEHSHQPVGCLACRGTGFFGRTGIYEVLKFNENVKNLIQPNIDLDELRKVAYQEGMRPLRLSGAQKVAMGATTIEEVLRVTPLQRKIIL